MPQVTVYIRDDDLDKWKGLDKKSEFIHKALNGVSFEITSKAGSDYTIKPIKTPEPGSAEWVTKTVNEAIIKTPEDAETVITNLKAKVHFPKMDVKLCKVHDTPLDGRGKCLQKGCKYS